MFLKHTPGYKMGSCSNGFERDKGRLIHAVQAEYKPDAISYASSVCGATIGRRSAGWHLVDPLTPYTCQRCLRKLIKQYEKEGV